MTYNPLIPQSTDNLSNSQVQLLDNFGQLNTQFAIDHTAFNTGSGNGDGFHKKVTLPGNVTPPTPAAGKGAIYGKTTTSITIPYYRRDGLAGTPEFSLLPIRAFGAFNGATGATLGTAMNLSCVRNLSGQYTLTMGANVVSGTNYTILMGLGNTTGTRIIMQYLITSATTFHIQAVVPGASFADPEYFSLAVLQL